MRRIKNDLFLVLIDLCYGLPLMPNGALIEKNLPEIGGWGYSPLMQLTAK